MGHDASLYHLFSRSSYSREASEENRKNQKEVFTVAALGFVLKHDLTFRAAFLKCLLGVTMTNEQAACFEVRCQEGHCSDLKVTDGITVLTVETKLDADLAEHQDPERTEYFCANKGHSNPKTGYGRQIIANNTNARHLCYVVIRKTAANKSGSIPINGTTIEWAFKNWKDMLPGPKTPLTEEFFELLARFHVQPFTSRMLSGLSCAEKTSDAVNIFKTLEGVCSALNLQFGQDVEWDVDFGTPNAFFGVKIKKGVKAFAELEAMVNSKGPVAWFGFEQKAEPRRSVWLYISDSSLGQLETLLVKLGFAVSRENTFIVIEDRTQEDDITWFHSVISKLQTLRQSRHVRK